MMLDEISTGIWVHQSTFMQSNAIAVRGDGGVLLVDPGIVRAELAAIGDELGRLGLAVAAGFSTHPHWDHLLWDSRFGDAPRYGTARCAAVITGRLADPGWRGAVAGMIPVDLIDDVPLDELFGRIAGLPESAERLPWSGPEARVLEHNGHAPGHAALVVDDRVLIAGDMLSDVLVPILNAMSPDPVADYLAALDLIDTVAVDLVVPGHGSVGDATELRARIDRDRAYLEALRDGSDVVDPRIGATAKPGWEWVTDLHNGQRERLQGS